MADESEIVALADRLIELVKGRPDLQESVVLKIATADESLSISDQMAKTAFFSQLLRSSKTSWQNAKLSTQRMTKPPPFRNQSIP